MTVQVGPDRAKGVCRVSVFQLLADFAGELFQLFQPDRPLSPVLRAKAKCGA
jgi:hypothetical protein